MKHNGYELGDEDHKEIATVIPPLVDEENNTLHIAKANAKRFDAPLRKLPDILLVSPEDFTDLHQKAVSLAKAVIKRYYFNFLNYTVLIEKTNVDAEVS